MAMRPKIHIINPLWDDTGGSELHALSMYDVLKPHADVTLWTEYDPHPALAARYPIRRIDAYRLHLPWTGVFLFVGCYFHVGRWIKLTRPQRQIVLLNTPHFDAVGRFLDRISGGKPQTVELVYASEAIKTMFGRPGLVEPSPIDLMVFRPSDAPPRHERFTIGRLSRDHETKHHADDPALYRRLVEAGFKVRIMGGKTMKAALAGFDSPDLQILPAGAERPADFLHSLDCFFYRTAENWYEAYGRVVFEAMACGLPVVASRRGGYSEFVSDGSDALLFDDETEAISLLEDLRANPARCVELGSRARKRAEAIYRDGVMLDIVKYYIQRSSTKETAPI